MLLPILQTALTTEHDIVLVRQEIKQLAVLAGLPAQEQTRLVTAVSEILRNAIQYCNGGKVDCLIIDGKNNRQLLQVIVRDSGAGIPQLESILEGSYKSRTGMGLGITGARKIVDEFSIDSSPDSGTIVRLAKLIPADAPQVTPAVTAAWAHQLAQNLQFSPVEELQQQNQQLILALQELQNSQNALQEELSHVDMLNKELEITNASILSLYKELDEKNKQLFLKKEMLEQRSNQLQEISRLKGEFLANMSHEIRTPLNAILGMSEILMRSTQSLQQISHLKVIRDAGRGLLTLIGDILDFSKIEAGKMTIEFIDFDLIANVEGSAQILAGQAAAKGLSLLTHIDPKLPSIVRGDPGRLRQILLNLASNAIKFSNQGVIVIRALLCSDQDKTVTIKFSVTDNGIGLTGEEQNRLFQPFVQADGSTTRKFGGTGLGLSICKQLVELMHGEIGINSVKGQGSTFWFTLPFEYLPGAFCGQAITHKLQGKRILVIDEDKNSRELISVYLDKWGLECLQAANSTDALDKLHSQLAAGAPIDISLVDLSKDQSFKLQHELLIDPKLARTLLVYMTAFDRAGQGEEALCHGFKAYLKKPIRQSQLLDCLVGMLTAPQLATISDTITAAGQKELAAAIETSRAQRSGLVLLAEDHPANQIVAQLQLNELGVSVHVVNNGQEAVDAAATNQYQLILMDCHMPEMDGFEATAAIRLQEIKSGKHIPIIAMTAAAMVSDKEKCKASGMDDYVSKPVEIAALQAVLDRWLPGHTSQHLNDTERYDNMTPAGPKEDIDLDRFMHLGTKYAGEIIEVFLDTTDIDMKNVAQSIANKESKELFAAAHKLKGACGTVGAKKLHKLSEKLESAAKEMDWKQAEKLLQLMQASVTNVRDKSRKAGLIR